MNLKVILDAVYRDENGDGVYNVNIEEYGYDQFQRRFERRNIYGNITNGIRSEYNMACAIYDLWDGPAKGLPTLFPVPTGQVSNRHGFNDLDNNSNVIVDNTGNPIQGEWTESDNVELTFAQIIDPLRLSVQRNALITSISDYSSLLMVLTPDCNVRNRIANCFNQNEVVLDIPQFRAGQNTGNNSDALSLNYQEGSTGISPFFARYYINPYFGLRGQNQFSFTLANGDALTDNLPIIGTGAANTMTLTSTADATASTCGPVTIQVRQAGLIVGNGTNPLRLEIRNGSVLRLQAGGVLTIANNSTVVIDCGARLIYENGANIVLGGSNARLIINGTLQLVGVASLPVPVTSAPQAIAISLSGNILGCGSNSITASVPSLGAGTVYNWSVSPGLSILSPNPTASNQITIGSSGSGVGTETVSLAISSTCSVLTSSVNITKSSGIFNSSQYPVSCSGTVTCGGRIFYSTTQLPGATYYNWTGIPSGAEASGQGTPFFSLGNIPKGITSVTISLRVDNACGNGNGTSSCTTTVTCSGFLAYPNPAESTFTVEKSAAVLPESSTAPQSGIALATSQATPEVFEVQLYSPFGLKVRTGSSQGDKVSINTANLPNGVYALQIMQNGQLLETQQIVIVH
jgi:hypothetical protein